MFFFLSPSVMDLNLFRLCKISVSKWLKCKTNNIYDQFLARCLHVLNYCIYMCTLINFYSNFSIDHKLINKWHVNICASKIDWIFMFDKSKDCISDELAWEISTYENLFGGEDCIYFNSQSKNKSLLHFLRWLN